MEHTGALIFLEQLLYRRNDKTQHRSLSNNPFGWIMPLQTQFGIIMPHYHVS